MRLLYIFLLLFFFSCKPRVPKDILPPDKMEQVFTDYIRADVYLSDFVSRDSSKNRQVESVKLQKQVFNKHKITREVFYKSLDYYLKNTSLFSPILDTISVKTNRAETDELRKRLNVE